MAYTHSMHARTTRIPYGIGIIILQHCNTRRTLPCSSFSTSDGMSILASYPLSAPPLVDTPAPATQYVAALSIVQPARSRCSSSSAGAPAGHTLGPQVSSSDASMRGRTKKAGGGEWCAAARCKPTNSNAYKQTIHSRAPMSRTHHRRSGNLSPSLHTACRRPTVPGAVGRPWLC